MTHADALDVIAQLHVIQFMLGVIAGAVIATDVGTWSK